MTLQLVRVTLRSLRRTSRLVWATFRFAPVTFRLVRHSYLGARPGESLGDDPRIVQFTWLSYKAAHEMLTIRLKQHPTSGPAIPPSQRPDCSRLAPVRIMGGEHSLRCPSCDFLLGAMVNPRDLVFEELKCPCCKVTSWLLSPDPIS